MSACQPNRLLPKKIVSRFLNFAESYIDAGAFEFDSNGTGGGILETSRNMRDVLLAKGYEVHYQQFVGGHDYLSWRGTLADGLIDLIGTTN